MRPSHFSVSFGWLQRMGAGLTTSECQRVIRASPVNCPSRLQLELAFLAGSWLRGKYVLSIIVQLVIRVLETHVEALRRKKQLGKTTSILWSLRIYKYCILSNYINVLKREEEGNPAVQGTSGRVWTHFWLLELRCGERYWHPMSTVQGCFWTSYNAQDGPQSNPECQ